MHDLPLMVALMGGPDRFVRRPQHAFANGLIDVTNEPSFVTPWLFHVAGRPDLSAFWADKVFARFTAEGYPGDEDGGAMGSHYLWNAMGLFPLAGQARYFLHGPRFDAVTLNLESGRRFEMAAARRVDADIYIQSAALNGAPLRRAWLSHAEITAGGRVDLRMGPSPGQWLADAGTAARVAIEAGRIWLRITMYKRATSCSLLHEGMNGR